MLIIPTNFEDEFPDEAQVLMDMCQDRAETRGQNKTLYLDAPQPIEMIYHNHRASYEAITTISGVVKVGRNEPCPCNSGKKYKKCCIMK